MNTFEQLITPLKTFLDTKGHSFDEITNSKALFLRISP